MTKSVPSEADMNWAAGLFEGEGTITIAVRNLDSTYRLVCIMGNTDMQVVKFFDRRWRGWVQPAYGERPGRKPAWYWTVAGPAAAEFLQQIQPYLRTSRVKKKCKLALQFRDGQSRDRSVFTRPVYKRKQRALYLRMKALNRRGIA